MDFINPPASSYIPGSTCYGIACNAAFPVSPVLFLSGMQIYIALYNLKKIIINAKILYFTV